MSTSDSNPELPADSDVEEATASRPLPAHVQPGYLALVALGGMIGTGLRELIVLAVPAVGPYPVAIFGINIVGAFVLGALLETLALGGSDEGRRRRLRLFVGTGVLGGFTTYSALATDSGLLLTGGQPGPAVVYAVATVLLGAVASWLGIAVGGLLGRRRKGARS
ncbi:CrcB family protein [Herbiconiux sp. 11R-BC]|uniref:fluoride efflux transporter FluC n=1 Tax=Herbiconiux sp. 11R-BC TaxID=3111637 RepID=UPI003C0C778E